MGSPLQSNLNEKPKIHQFIVKVILILVPCQNRAYCKKYTNESHFILFVVVKQLLILPTNHLYIPWKPRVVMMET